MYIGSADGHLNALNASSGVSLWDHDTGSFSASTPSASGDVVYVSNIRNVVVALDISEMGAELDNFAGVHAADTEPAESGWFRWKRYIGSGGAKSVVDDGVVYASNSKRLLALDAETGNELWWRTNGGLVGWLYAWVVVSDGVVYMPTAFNRMSALDGATGTTLWDFPTEGRTFVSPIIADGAAYFASYGRYVRPQSPPYLNSVDAHTGDLLWRTEVGYRGLLRVLPNVQSGIAYYGTDRGYMYARDTTTGTLVWEFRAGGQVQTHPSIADGIVYFTSWDNNLYAVDANSGELQWQFSDGLALGWPVVEGGSVYINGEENIYALDAETGAVLWQRMTLDDYHGHVRLKLYRNIVYATSPFSGTLVMDARTGDVLWDYVGDFGFSGAISELSIADGYAYLVDEDSKLLIIDPVSGEVLSSVGIGSPGWSHSFTIENEMVYIRSRDNYLYALRSPVISRLWFLLGIR